MSNTESPDDGCTDAELLDYACRLIAGGYCDKADFPEMLYEWVGVDNDDDQDLKARISTAIEQAVALQLKKQESYPLVTDYDRLRQAFDRLEAAGFLARESYACCQNCAWGDIEEELAEAAQAGPAYTGVVFFHEQDVETVVECSELYLAYGGVGDAATEGRQVVQALQEAGLSVEWDGSVTTRIRVPMTWQRRLVL